MQRQLAFLTDGKTKIRVACGRNSTGFFVGERYTDKGDDALFCIAQTVDKGVDSLFFI